MVVKEEIRELVLDERLAMPEDELKSRSEVIQKRLLQSEYWPKTGRVALYASVKNEVQTFDLFQSALEKALHVYFPRVEQGIEFYEVNGPEDLQKGSWAIPEPKLSCAALPEGKEFDLMVVPGIVFDPKGYRIGYGKGFYDQAIEKHQAFTLALAFDFQIKEGLPRDPWDQKIDVILTENHIYVNDQAAPKKVGS